MAMFTVRVELHGATYADYEMLHSAMAHAGFSRTIRANNGADYHLPTAEYYGEGNLARSKVLTFAQSAVAQTGCPSSILVTEAIGCTWQGLVPA